MKQNNLIKIIITILLLSSGCNAQVASGPALDNNAPVKTVTTINNPFNLKVNEIAEISSESLKIKFVSIEDSRCAYDVQCIWAGNVKIKLTVTINDKSAGDVDLVSEPGKMMEPFQNIGNYTIMLNAIKPETRKSKETRRPSDYVISLSVSKT